MALLSVIRRWAMRDQLSIREIARRTGLGGFPLEVQEQLVQANLIWISLPRPLKKAWIGVA